MAPHQFRITDYSIHLGGRFQAVAGDMASPVVVTAFIACRGEGGEIIRINFYRANEPGEAIPPAISTGEDGKLIGHIWEPEASYPAFVDLIRNESPIWGYIDEASKPPQVEIFTGQWEPVGVGDEDFGR